MAAAARGPGPGSAPRIAPDVHSPGVTPRSLPLLGSVLVALLLAPASTRAFSLFPELSSGSPQAVLAQAARWSSVTGLDGGIQVGIAPGVAAALQVDGDALADVEQAILDGIEAWASPVLQFDVQLDAAGTVEGPELGFEIDLFAVSDSHPLFVANPQAFTGLAVPAVDFFASRPLTNGQASSGYGITGADLYLNIDNFEFLAPLGASRLQVLTRVVIHELGHALGLGHPNETTSYDTDLDPFNAMPIDPADPFAGLIVSPNIDVTTVMSNEPCGPNPTAPCPAAFFTSLGPDELGGRAVLYPVPEPTTGMLVALGLLAGAQRPRRRSTSRRRPSTTARVRDCQPIRETHSGSAPPGDPA